MFDNSVTEAGSSYFCSPAFAWLKQGSIVHDGARSTLSLSTLSESPQFNLVPERISFQTFRILAIWNGEGGSNFIKICQQSKVKNMGEGGVKNRKNVPTFFYGRHLSVLIWFICSRHQFFYKKLGPKIAENITSLVTNLRYYQILTNTTSASKNTPRGRP